MFPQRISGAGERRVRHERRGDDGVDVGRHLDERGTRKEEHGQGSRCPAVMNEPL